MCTLASVLTRGLRMGGNLLLSSFRALLAGCWWKSFFPSRSHCIPWLITLSILKLTMKIVPMGENHWQITHTFVTHWGDYPSFSPLLLCITKRCYKPPYHAMVPCLGLVLITLANSWPHCLENITVIRVAALLLVWLHPSVPPSVPPGQ